MKRSLLLTLLACFCLAVYGQNDVRSRGSGGTQGTTAQAQQGTTKTYTGKVIDNNGEPLVGATVTVVDAAGNTVSGTYTDAEGNFTITAQGGAGYVAKISYINYGVKELALENDVNVLNVTLEETVSNLDEVVVVGYGTSVRRDLTGSVGTVEGGKIAQMQVQSFDQAIQGRVAGVQIQSANGLPGVGVSFRVRGTNSISASSQPLVVVDGVPMNTTGSAMFANTQGGGTNALADINFNDIESIDILKDGYASAIYGSRAANGVVMITTKKGKAGKTRVDVNFNTGFTSPTKLLNLLDGPTFNTVKNLANTRATGGPTAPGYPYNGTFTLPISSLPGATTPFAEPYNTDWLRAVTRNDAATNDLNFGISGGDAKTTFYVGGRYFWQEAYIRLQNFNQINGRLNLEHRLNDKFKIGVNLTINRSINQRSLTDNAVESPISSALLWFPNRPIYNVSGGTAVYEFLGGTNPVSNVGLNVIGLINIYQSTTTTTRVIGNGYLQYEPINGLIIRSDFGTDYTVVEDYRRTGSGSPFQPTGSASNTRQEELKWLTNNTVSYRRSFDNSHNFSILGNYSFETSKFGFTQAAGQGFVSDALRNVNAAANVTTYSSGVSEWSLLSYTARLDYNYREKYFVGVSYRRDGHSRFSPNNKYGNFGAASVAWRFSQEDFIKSFDFLNEGKFRASIGQTGNAEIGNFPWQTQYSGTNTGNYLSSPGTSPTVAGNTDLRWETNTKYDIGLDLVFWKNRVSLTVDWFYQNNTNLLLARPLPFTTGFASVNQNVGAMFNTGWEFTTKVNILNGKVKWDVDANITFLRNRITALPDGNPLPSGGVYRLQEGLDISQFFLIPWAGVDPATGNPQYRIFDESIATVPNVSRDSRSVGSGIPNSVGGFGSTVSYMNFDLTMLFVFSQGNFIYQGSNTFMMNSNNAFNNRAEILNFWTTPGQITDVPRLNAGLSVANGGAGIALSQASTRWLEDGSYIRLRNITLGYNFDAKLVNRIGLRNLRIYVQGFNLLTWTKYTGMDPEVNTVSNAAGIQGNVQAGNEFLTPPQARTVNIGINVGF